MTQRFKLVRVMMGSGWPSGHVAIDRYYSWDDRAGGGEMCLTLDAQNAEELCTEIDELVAELVQLKESVPRRFEGWAQEHQSKKMKSSSND